MEPLESLLTPWVYGPVASLALVLALILAKRQLFAVITRMAARTTTHLDDLFLEAANRPVNLLIVATGLHLLGRLLPLEAEVDQTTTMLYKACFVGAGVWFVDRLTRGLLSAYAGRGGFISQSRGPIQGLVRGLFIGLGILILLDSMGISITPLLASLGVGSLAVALALQPTLANMFSGMQLLADKAIERGQFIRLESGEEGFVERIGWRSTRVRRRDNVMLILPNSRIVESAITNYSLPDDVTSFLVEVGVHYGSDLTRVEAVTLDVAREVLRQVEGGVPGFEPLVRFSSFGDSSIRFNVVMQARSYPDHNLLVHELVKRLQERYRREGIVMPYPIRTLDVAPEVLDRLGRRGPGS